MMGASLDRRVFCAVRLGLRLVWQGFRVGGPGFCVGRRVFCAGIAVLFVVQNSWATLEWAQAQAQTAKKISSFLVFSKVPTFLWPPEHSPILTEYKKRLSQLDQHNYALGLRLIQELQSNRSFSREKKVPAEFAAQPVEGYQLRPLALNLRIEKNNRFTPMIGFFQVDPIPSHPALPGRSARSIAVSPDKKQVMFYNAPLNRLEIYPTEKAQPPVIKKLPAQFQNPTDFMFDQIGMRWIAAKEKTILYGYVDTKNKKKFKINMNNKIFSITNFNLIAIECLVENDRGIHSQTIGVVNAMFSQPEYVAPATGNEIKLSADQKWIAKNFPDAAGTKVALNEIENGALKWTGFSHAIDSRKLYGFSSDSTLFYFLSPREDRRDTVNIFSLTDRKLTRGIPLPENEKLIWMQSTKKFVYFFSFAPRDENYVLRKYSRKSSNFLEKVQLPFKGAIKEVHFEPRIKTLFLKIEGMPILQMYTQTEEDVARQRIWDFLRFQAKLKKQLEALHQAKKQDAQLEEGYQAGVDYVFEQRRSFFNSTLTSLTMQQKIWLDYDQKFTQELFKIWCRCFSHCNGAGPAWQKTLHAYFYGKLKAGHFMLKPSRSPLQPESVKSAMDSLFDAVNKEPFLSIRNLRAMVGNPSISPPKDILQSA